MARKRKQDDEGSEVTRCICGHEELSSSAAKKSGVDAGLFIQCDKCHVWQHGYCVGFSSASDVPDVYYCEKCEPSLHEVVERPNGRTSTYLPSEKSKRSKRRSSSISDSAGESASGEGSRPSADERRRRTLNSREDVILQRVLEQSAQEALEAERRRSSVKDEDADENDDEDEDEDKDGKEDGDEEDGESADEAEPDAEADAEIADADAEDAAGNEDGDVEDSEGKEKSRETTPDGDNSGAEQPTKPESPEPVRKKRRGEPKRPVKRRAAAPAKKPPVAPLQLSKKCKPRIPPPRSTLAEMRKRIQAIMEFSGRTQIEMLKEAEARDAFVQGQRSRGAESNAVAMENLGAQHQANIQTLEALTRKLLDWQELYG